MIPGIFCLVLAGSFVAAASAYIGSLMVLKRMSLVGDALTHVALPGMAIAISLNFSPSLGAFIALMLAIVGIWYLEENSDAYPEAIVGIFFTGSLALGVLLSKETDLLEALFGSLEKMTYMEAGISIIISIAVLILTYLLSRKILVAVISPELAKSSGINVSQVNLFYLILVGIIVSLGIRFVGTLLMGALVIVPAVSARNITRNISGYMITSSLIGVLSAILGIYFAYKNNIPSGAVVVVVSIIFFLITYILKKIVNK